MRSQRGIILATVMILGTAALWLAAALAAQASIDTSDVDAGVDHIQRQSAVRSAMLVVASRLQDQRSMLRSGGVPALKSQWSLWETGPRTTVGRLIEQWDGALLRPEAASIDLNMATRDVLSALPGLSESAADAIIAYRNQATIGDIRELVDLEALSDITLHGTNGLLNYVTVHAHEPNMQSSGDLRINLNVEWSEELGERIQERYGEEAAEILRQVLNGAPLASDAELVALMQRYELHPDDWHEPLDGLTAESGVFRRGRVDINLASAEVLQTLPGVSAEQATAAVDHRQALKDEDRQHATWPISENIWPTSIATEVLPLITVGTWTWRVRLAVGEVPTNDLEAPLQRPAIYEVVFDLAGEQPLISSIRDISLEAYALQWQDAGQEVSWRDEDQEEFADVGDIDERPDDGDRAGSEVGLSGDIGAAETAPDSTDDVEAIDLNAADPTVEDPRLGRWRP